MENKNSKKKQLTVGHLYWHKTLKRVERITELHAFGVVVHRHHKIIKASLSRHFRRATPEEIATYLGK